LFQDHWHKGVVGIVASRLIDTFYRPTVILTQTGNVVSGSARSVPGFNLYEAVHACRKYLLGYGGHFAAAGLTLLPENINRFADKFEEVVSQTTPPELLIPEITIDAEIKFSDITFSFYHIICQMEPFGPDNMTPVFISRNVDNSGLSRVVKEKHIRFVLRQGKAQFTGIGFNLADKFALLVTHKNIDVVYKIEENEFMGSKSLQLKIIDFRTSGNESTSN
jgi:single-stranded-DNA-specific exonuclease